MHLLQGISDGEWDKFYGRSIVINQPTQLEKNWQVFFYSLFQPPSSSKIPVSTEFELFIVFSISWNVFHNLNWYAWVSGVNT